MQTELCILDDNKGIALLYVLIVVETNLLDESRHTGIDRGDMAVYLCIICVSHIAAMIEMAEAPADSSQKKEDNHYIIYSLDNLLAHNLLIIVFDKNS